MSYVIPKEIEDYIIAFGLPKVDIRRFETAYIPMAKQYVITVHDNGCYNFSVINHSNMEKYDQQYIFAGYYIDNLNQLKVLLGKNALTYMGVVH